MSVKVHLLGGSGRIGRALVDSLVAQPLPDVSTIQIYCDSTKVAGVQSRYSGSTSLRVASSGYSAFNTISEASQSDLSALDTTRHIVFNLRGINNKQQWLNQPLDLADRHNCETRCNRTGLS
jgi:hypothetical protein